MAIKDIITEPNKLLRQISKPVKNVGKEEQNLMDDMLDTMYSANGIGLAAVQIGVPKRIIVMDLSRNNEKKEPMYFVNPVIQNKNPKKSTYEEESYEYDLNRRSRSNEVISSGRQPLASMSSFEFQIKDPLKKFDKDVSLKSKDLNDNYSHDTNTDQRIAEYSESDEDSMKYIRL